MYVAQLSLIPTFSICLAIESAVLFAHLSSPVMNLPNPALTAAPPLPLEPVAEDSEDNQGEEMR